jgi:serine/threonine protein kinase
MLNEVVGNYKVLDKIGEGGMGEVFKAIDVMLEREVAIKVLRPELADKPEIVARFRKEAVVLAKLNHPNIATLYNFVHHGDRYFMVMEFAHGQTLDVIIDRHPNGLPWRRSLALFLDALHAIEQAHNLDIVHRDVKPSNMMVNDRDILKVLDFGIARVLGSAHLTRSGHLVGTLNYMSPEQIRGRDTDARSDMYSLGMVLYKMLSGRMPFAAEGEFELMRAQIEEHPPPLRDIVPEVPQAVDDAVLQALAKSPNDRFQTAAEFIDAIGQALREDADGFLGAVPPWSVRTKSVRSESGPVHPRLGMSGKLARAATEISGLPDRGRRGTDDASVPTEVDIAPEPLPAWKPPPPLGRRLAEAPIELPPMPLPPYDATRRKAQQRIKPVGATPDPIIRSLLALERDLPPQPPGGRSGRIAPQRADPRPTAPASLDETPTEHRAADRDPLGAAGMSRAGVARWVFRFALLLAAGLTIAILNGAFSPQLDPLRIVWLMERGEEALAAGKVSGPRGDTAATYAEEALQLAPEQVEARKLLADVVARLVEAGESSVKQGELPEAKLHWAEAQRLAVKYAAGEEEVATLEKRIMVEEARRAAIIRQKEAEEQRRKHMAALIEQGREALDAGRLREAVAQAQEVLGLAPESAEARQVLSDAAEGMVKDAEDALTRGDLAAAKTGAQDARALVQQHGLPQAKLADVRTRIAQEEQRRAELQRQRQEQERQAEQKRAEEAALAARNGLSRVTEQEREIEKLRPEQSMREQAPSLTPLPKAAPGPTPGRDQPVGVSPEPAGQAAEVEILAATSTQALATPGNTIEFYTRFHLARGAYVEATWVLKRDGRSLGEPGAASVFAKPGIGTLSTALTLPPGMARGRYTVEHRIETENGEDSARSHFSVVSR